MFVKQSKATDLKSIPNFDLHTLGELPGWYASVKYDGHYVQIHIDDEGGVRFFTSGGKEFAHCPLEDELKELRWPAGIYEAEFIGSSDGKLGDRGKAAVLTTYRTQFAKGEPSTASIKDTIMVFDYLDEVLPFSQRLRDLRDLPETPRVNVVMQTMVTSVENLMKLHARTIADGLEGLIIKSGDHRHVPGRRLKTALKMKSRQMGEFKCVGTTLGEGKYTGLIGALVCEDNEGNHFRVGSGLTDVERAQSPESYIDKMVKVSYERSHHTLVQPVFGGLV